MDCLHTAKYEVYVWRASKTKTVQDMLEIHCISLVNTKFGGGWWWFSPTLLSFFYHFCQTSPWICSSFGKLCLPFSAFLSELDRDL